MSNKKTTTTNQPTRIGMDEFGFQRQRDLLQIVCALVSNPDVYPSRYSIKVVVEDAKNILQEVESQSK